jgi:hypothetical protein
MNSWVLAIFVVTLYIHLFNTIARMYLDSGRSLTLYDIYRRIVPPTKLVLEV